MSDKPDLAHEANLLSQEIGELIQQQMVRMEMLGLSVREGMAILFTSLSSVVAATLHASQLDPDAAMNMTTKFAATVLTLYKEKEEVPDGEDS